MDRSKLLALVSTCVMTAAAKGHAVEGVTAMMQDDQNQAKVSQLVQTEQRWKSADVNLTRLEAITADGCSFYIASHKTQPLSHDPNYAVLPGGQVVSESDPQAARRILDACGSQADASAWAEVVARFHPDAAPGTVLYDAKKAQFAFEKAARAGYEFRQPTFANGAGKTVEFYLMNFESSDLYHVKATRRDDGAIEVRKKLAS